MNGQELAREVADSVNSGIDESEFRDEMQRSHNALQRYAFDSVFRQGIVALAGTPQVDARNKRVVEQSREICEMMDWEY